jgi:hydroxyacid-oxoacid transhydrogenase
MKKIIKKLKFIYHTFGTCSACCSIENNINLENGFEMKSNNFKFGKEIINEVGFDSYNIFNMKRIGVFTDKNLKDKYPVQMAIDSLKKFESKGLKFDIFDEVCIEPTDISCKEGIKFAIDGKFDGKIFFKNKGFISIGGGSVIDTAKIANLYSTFPTSNFLTYVNAPIGIKLFKFFLILKGLAQPIKNKLKPHISIPTTCGTGAEATGFAIFELTSLVKFNLIKRNQKQQ